MRASWVGVGRQKMNFIFTYFGLYRQMGLEVCIVFKPKKGVFCMRGPNASETYLYVLNISLQRSLESSLNASLIT